MAPLVSIVVPTFNNGPLIRETLEGINRQTFQDFEIIVIDDGSTDNTRRVVQEYDAAIVYIYQSNKGPAAARNEGVRLAQGEFIAFCDHDDIWNEGHLENLLDLFSAYPATSMTFDNAEFFGATEAAGEVHLGAKESCRLTRGPITAKALLRNNFVASMSNVMIRRSLFIKLGGLNETVGVVDDFHFHLRVASAAIVRFVDYVGVRKRVGENNLCKTVNIKQQNVAYLEDILKNYPEVLKATGRFSFRSRLARKYFKLARSYRRQGDADSARVMFRKAYRTNFINLRYFLSYANTRIKK